MLEELDQDNPIKAIIPVETTNRIRILLDHAFKKLNQKKEHRENSLKILEQNKSDQADKIQALE